MKRTNASVGALALAGLLTISLAACGSDNATGDADPTTGGSDGASEEPMADLSGELVGAGASSQESAMNAWIASFQSANPDVSVAYDPVGSGGGRTQFIEGGTDFGGSDAYLDEEEVAAATERCGEVIELPIYISPIAVIYNLPGLSADLNLSPTVLAQIFNGDITSWDDPAIAELNPDAELPATAITPVHRSDESGTTSNFTDYLAQAAGEAWPYEADGVWPISGGQSGAQTSGMVSTVQAAEGTIGYADASQAGSLGTVAIQVGEDFVPYSAEAAAAVVDASANVEGRGEYDYAIELDRATDAAGAYPIVLVSYELACTTYESQEKADLVKAFLSYIVSEDGQQVAADNAGSAPISDTLRDEAMTAIEAITAS